MRRLGLAAGLSLLWADASWAQSDPAFPATAATGQGAASSANGGGNAATGAGAAGGPSSASGVVSVPPPLRATTPLLPFTGNTAQGGGLRDTAESSLSPPLDRAARNWTLTPILGVGEEYTTNGLSGFGTGHHPDFITLITPGFSASGVSTRLQGSASYNPEVDIYARHFNQSRVNQNFGGDVLATLLPGSVFLDLRAYGGVTTNGAGGNGGTSVAGNNLQTQSLAFSASPYALQRFGDVGTAEIGASLSYSSSNGVNGSNIATTNVNPFFNGGHQDSTTYGAHAGFQTGEAFGRYNGTALASLSQSQGSGVLSNSARDTFTIDNGYGVTRLFTALGTVGYEHIRYSGSSPVRIDDEIWNVGFRLTLGPTSSLQLGYGHHDGFNSLTLNAALQPTARTRLYARYSEGLDTEAEQLQNGLATADFDQLGNPVDHTSGAPLLLGTTGAFGAQNNLFKTRRASVTAVLLEDRDVFSATVDAEDNRLVSTSGLPNQLGSNQGVFGSLNWSHELSPTLSLSSFAQYGLRTARQSGTQHVISASTALVKTLSETLSAQLRYSYNRNTGGSGVFAPTTAAQTVFANGQSLSNYDQSVILLSATKSF